MYIMNKNLESHDIRNIKFIATIGNVEKIFKELDVSVSKAKIPENIEDLQNQLTELKSDFESEKYNNSDVLEKFITNKNGKYLILCKDLNQMQNYIERVEDLFGGINKNIKLAYTKEDTFGNAKRISVEEFKSSKNNSEGLKLFFINRVRINECDISDFDGAIMLYARKDNTRENLETVEKVLEKCSDNSVVVQFNDSIETIGKYPNFRQILKNSNEYKMDFEESEAFKVIKAMRDNIYFRGVNSKFKLKLMREYENATNKKIYTRTVYNGHNIGSWKSNMRQGYLNGKLHITEDVKEKFEDSGIFQERQRRYPAKDIEKYNLILAFNKENPDTEIKLDTMDKDGNPIGYYRYTLQAGINRNTSNLEQEQITHLRQLGYLHSTPKEIEEISKKYNIPNNIVFLILKKHKSVDEFVSLYKHGKNDMKNIELNKKGIVLSKNELTVKQKQRYINLVEDIFGENVLDDTSKYILEEDLLLAINSLPDRKKTIISKRFGLNGEEPSKYREIAEFLQTSKQHARGLIIRSLNKIGEKIKIYSIEDLEKDKAELLEQIKFIEEMDYDEWEKNKLDIDIECLDLTKNVKDKLTENGYKKVWDLAGVSENKLFEIKGLGVGKISQIINEVDDICAPLMEEKKEEEINNLKDKLNFLNTKIEEYNRAYNFYMNDEDIFNQEQIIPASIVEFNSSLLNEKKQEKNKKQNTLNYLKNEINKQDKKTKKIISVLDDNQSFFTLNEKKKDE